MHKDRSVQGRTQIIRIPALEMVVSSKMPMHRAHTLKLSLAILLLTAQGFAHADPASDALKVIHYRLAMTNPSTVFDKWQADQWLFVAAHCGNAAGLKKELQVLDELPVYF